MQQKNLLEWQVMYTDWWIIDRITSEITTDWCFTYFWIYRGSVNLEWYKTKSMAWLEEKFIVRKIGQAGTWICEALQNKNQAWFELWLITQDSYSQLTKFSWDSIMWRNFVVSWLCGVIHRYSKTPTKAITMWRRVVKLPHLSNSPNKITEY